MTEQAGASTVFEIPLGSVLADPSAWPRSGWDESRVAEFVTLLADDPQALPPIDVVQSGDGYLIADGWHRTAAAQALRAKTIQARLLSPDGEPRKQAFRHGLVTAARSALPLSRADRRAAVRRLIEESPQSSDREIARLCGVSPTTVGSARRVLQGSPEGVGQPEPGDLYYAAVTARDLARKLVTSLDKLYAARGLTESLLGERTGHRLAVELRNHHGDDALVWARRLAQWSNAALAELDPGTVGAKPPTRRRS